MKFMFNGVEYRIGFQYENRKTGRNKIRNYCTARIETGDERVGTHKTVAQGTVVRYHKDKFVKEEARQYALDAALLKNTMFPLGAVGEMFHQFNSEARTAYHTRPGGLRTKQIERKAGVKTATASVWIEV